MAGWQWQARARLPGGMRRATKSSNNKQGTRAANMRLQQQQPPMQHMGALIAAASDPCHCPELPRSSPPRRLAPQLVLTR